MCVSCRLLSKGGAAGKELPFRRARKHRARQTVPVPQHSHSAAHLDTEGGPGTFLAAARKGAPVMPSVFLWCWCGRWRQPNPMIHRAPSLPPTPAACMAPPSVPANHCRRVTPLPRLHGRCHHGSILCKGRGWSPWIKGGILLRQLLVYFIQNIRKGSTLPILHWDRDLWFWGNAPHSTNAGV